ncbi:MAG: fused MFS/spermidine synthase [Planctomycetes bacterium]|nr:fused MFS/spermidine synthase [Planctomycetota bacterium]
MPRPATFAPRFGPLAFVFFLSGIPALIHETAWLKLFALVLGHGYFAVAATTSAFLLGLGLGALAGGRIADRSRRSLALYGFAEAWICLYAVLLPLLPRALLPLFRAVYARLGESFLAFNLVQFAIVLVVLLPPTLAMGATLPLMFRAAIPDAQRLARRGGLLYGANTLGAAAGAALGAFVLLPGAGLWGTLYAAAAANAGLAVAGFVLARQAGSAREGTPEAPPAAVERPGSASRVLVLAAVAMTGLAGLGCQIAWTRLLARIYGPTPYVFGLLLFPYILFHGMGALAASWLVPRLGRPQVAFGLLQLAAGVGVLLSLDRLGRIPLGLVELASRPEATFGAITFQELVWTSMAVAVPTLAGGASFPFALALWRASGREIGRPTGSLYLSNTLGAVAGAFATGYFLVPFFGLDAAFRTLVAAQAAAAFLALLSRPRARGLLVGLAAAAVVVLLATRAPGLPRHRIESAPYRNATDLAHKATTLGFAVDRVMADEGEFLYHEEDLLGSVSIRRDGEGKVSIHVDGNGIAGEGDFPTFRLIAHLPLAAHPEPRSVLVIGLGGGVTLRSATLHPLRSIDVVEISPGVIRAAAHPSVREAMNHDAVGAPGVRILHQDGRTHVLLAEDRYDVIVSQPHQLWVDGVSMLFTREFYAAARERLAPGGVYCQWVQGYTISADNVATILATFAASFEYVALWETIPGSDYCLLGSDRPICLDTGRLFEDPARREDLLEIGIDGPGRLLAGYLGGREEVLLWARDAPLQTDTGDVLGYSVPVDILHARGEPFHLARPLPRAEFPTDLALVGERVLQAAREGREARLEYLAAEAEFSRDREADGLSRLARALALDPNLPAARGTRRRVAQDHLVQGERAREAGRVDTACREYERAVAIDPELWQAHYNLAGLLVQMGEHARALEHYQAAVAAAPDRPEIHRNLGNTLARLERWPEAEAIFRRLIEEDPRDTLTLVNLGSLLARTGRLAEAEELWARAVEIDPARRAQVERVRPKK